MRKCVQQSKKSVKHFCKLVYRTCFIISTARCSSSHNISHNPLLLLTHFLIIPLQYSKTQILQYSKTPKLQNSKNSKTSKLQNSKTPKLQNPKTPKPQYSNTPILQKPTHAPTHPHTHTHI